MEVHDVSVFVQQHFPQPEFYIQDILPKQGVMLIYGSPKVRKSWLVQYLGFCMSLGEECLGFRTEQARVLLSNFEISPTAYYWRLRNMTRHFTLQEQKLYVVSPMLMYLDEVENFNRFRAMVRTIEPQVIILDCLAACFGGDENDGGQMAQWIEKVQELREGNTSLIIVHHTNKNLQTGSSVDRARGHSRLAGWVDTLVYMAEQPSGVQLQFKARQSSSELHNVNIGFENYLWSRR